MTEKEKKGWFKRFRKDKLLTLTALAFVQVSASAVASESIFDRVSGVWTWHEFASECSDKYETISFNEDKSRAVIRNSPGVLAYFNSSLDEANYTIHSYDERSITMSMDNEHRFDDEGKPVVWILSLQDDNTFVWNLVHWVTSGKNYDRWIRENRRVRCNNQKSR